MTANRCEFLENCKNLSIDLMKNNNLKIFYARAKKLKNPNKIQCTNEERKRIESNFDIFPNLTTRQYIHLNYLTNTEITNEDIVKFNKIKSIVQYKKSKIIGMIIVFQKNGQTFIGWSNFYIEDKKFDKYIGIYYACRRACLIDEATDQFKKNINLIKSNSSELFIQPKLMHAFKFILSKFSKEKIA